MTRLIANDESLAIDLQNDLQNDKQTTQPGLHISVFCGHYPVTPVALVLCAASMQQ